MIMHQTFAVLKTDKPETPKKLLKNAKAGAIQPWQSVESFTLFHFRDDFPSYESL